MVSSGQLFSLRWNNYLGHMTGAFESLRSEQNLVDVTLSCEGKKIKAHRMLLSACSSYFKDLFKDNPCQHPIVVFRNVKYEDLSALITFIYQGEVNVVQEQLSSFLATAELLEVRGLTDNSRSHNEEELVEREDTQFLEPAATLTHPIHVKSSISNERVKSPVSFIPLNKPIESQCYNLKKRKTEQSMREDEIDLSSHSRTKKLDKELPACHSIYSKQPVEIIPVPSNVKTEQPDPYYDQNISAYNTVSGQEKSQMEEFLSQAHSSDTKRENLMDLYGGTSDEGSHGLDPDIGQSAGKGTQQAVGDVSQDSIQGHWLSSLNSSSNTSGSSNSADASQKHRYVCNICGATYKHLRNLRAHCHLHYGKTRCTLCNKVLCNISYFKKHLQHQHGLLMDINSTKK